jgi:hypothetical protein
MRARVEQAIGLMTQFANRTALRSEGPAQRYLWTDAFAVCNFLALGRATGESGYQDLALRLVDQVHHVLGRHRADDARTGWISGLDAEQGEAHPTRGGLRIGKPLPERRRDETMDPHLEWDRDGQYFHYLTKWMHALDQVAWSTGQGWFNEWGRELAYAAHRAFVYLLRPGGRKRMYWKVSIDLSRPLVGSMGQHDPLDGLITYTQLETSAAGSQPMLAAAIEDFSAMVEPGGLVTVDPLGLGGLLTDAYRVNQLRQRFAGADDLAEALLGAALEGLRHYVAQPDLQSPARHRLAFRELGLAIGLAVLDREEWRNASRGARAGIDQLAPYLPLRKQIEECWLQPEHRRLDSWLDHENINDVMLATSLCPEGLLVIRPQPPV